MSPSQKLEFAKQAIAKGYRLEVFDLERLRSLLDTGLKEIRRRYLKIDDAIAARLRSEVKKLLRFPDAIADSSSPPTFVETLLTDQMPRRLFDLLIGYEESDVLEVPAIGEALHDHLRSYYRFRQEALRLEEGLVPRIGQIVAVRFPTAWRIYLRYAIMRFAGIPQATVIGWGDFLNYGITWADAERVFAELAQDSDVSAKFSDLFQLHDRLVDSAQRLDREKPRS